MATDKTRRPAWMLFYERAAEMGGFGGREGERPTVTAAPRLLAGQLPLKGASFRG